MTDLTRMLTLQRDLQANTYQNDLSELSPKARVQFIKDMVVAATDELHEALNETSWKPWTTSEGKVNEAAFFGELIDAWHFLMNLFLIAYPADSPAEIARRIQRGYEDKRATNAQRQLEGYDGVAGKCPGCSRALDDIATICGDVDPDDDSVWCDVQGEWYTVDGVRV